MSGNMSTKMSAKMYALNPSGGNTQDSKGWARASRRSRSAPATSSAARFAANLASQFKLWAVVISNFRNLIQISEFPVPEFPDSREIRNFGKTWWRFQISKFPEKIRQNFIKIKQKAAAKMKLLRKKQQNIRRFFAEIVRPERCKSM